MVDASELFDTPTPMGGDLLEGMKAVAINQKIPFRLYGRVVLPADGYIFWVKAQLLKQKPFQSGLVSAQQLSTEEMEACKRSNRVSRSRERVAGAEYSSSARARPTRPRASSSSRQRGWPFAPGDI